MTYCLRHRILCLVLLGLFGLWIGAATAVDRGEEPDFRLTILHNNDGESQLLHAGQGLEEFGGVARFKTLVDRLRHEATVVPPGDLGPDRAVVLLSSGDNFLASPELNASFDKGVPYYDAIAVDLLGYDAMALGNHEFDFGPKVLAQFLEGVQRPIPFVSANLDFSKEPGLQRLAENRIIVKSTVLRDKGRPVGIVGLTTPRIRYISSPRHVQVDPAIAKVAQTEIDLLTAQGVKIIVLISHLQNLREDLQLATKLTGLDVMIAGGGGEVLAGPTDRLVPGDRASGSYPLYTTGADGVRIPVVTTAGDYKYVGRLVVDFDGWGRLIRVDNSSGPVRVAGGTQPDAVPPDPQMQQQVVLPVQAYVGNLADKRIGFSDVALDGRRNPGLRDRETNLGNLMADALLWQAAALAQSYGVPAPDVAFQNSGGLRNNTRIPPGPLSELTTFDIAPFSDFVTVFPRVTRERFKQIMENAVSRIGSGRFLQIAGFRLIYDPQQVAQWQNDAGAIVTAGKRVRSIVLQDGTVIVDQGEVLPGPSVTIATTDFLARGGDQSPFKGVTNVILGVSYQQALRNYIQGPLKGRISAAEYPEGGEGRIRP